MSSTTWQEILVDLKADLERALFDSLQKIKDDSVETDAQLADEFQKLLNQLSKTRWLNFE